MAGDPRSPASFDGATGGAPVGQDSGRRLKPWQGVLTVVVAGAVGQGIGLVLVLVLVVAVASSRGQINPETMTGLAMEPWALLTGTTAMQLVLAALAFLVPFVIRVPARDALGLRTTRLPVFVLAPLGAVGLGPLTDLTAQTAVDAWPALDMGNLAMILGMVRATPLWVTWPLVALLPGLAEELLFRGVMVRSFARPGWGISISAVAFALFHMDPVHVLGVLPFGFYLGWLMVRTQSLWVCVVTHVANNTATLVAVQIPVLNVGFGADEPMPLWWVPVGLVFFTTMVVLIAVLVPARPHQHGAAVRANGGVASE